MNFKIIIAALLVSAAILLASGVMLFQRSKAKPGPFPKLAPFAICEKLHKRLPDGVFSGPFGRNCYQTVDSDVYSMFLDFDLGDDVLPVKAVMSGGRAPIQSVVIEIVGGPGTNASGRIGPVSWIDDGERFLSKCDFAIMTPSYSGTFYRSNYPRPSEPQAVREISGLVDSLSKEGVGVNIYAASLGGRIFANPEFSVPAGNHFLDLPMMQSPADLFDYYVNEELADPAMVKSIFNHYVIGRGGKRRLQRVNDLDYKVGFFDQENGRFDQDFNDLWLKKQQLSPNARISAMVAADDKRAGGREYLPVLNGLGVETVLVDGRHQPTPEHEKERLVIVNRVFFDRLCP